MKKLIVFHCTVVSCDSKCCAALFGIREWYNKLFKIGVGLILTANEHFVDKKNEMNKDNKQNIVVKS